MKKDKNPNKKEYYMYFIRTTKFFFKPSIGSITLALGIVIILLSWFKAIPEIVQFGGIPIITFNIGLWFIIIGIMARLIGR